jgi:F-type H+-transporting ATPase subunit b
MMSAGRVTKMNRWFTSLCVLLLVLGCTAPVVFGMAPSSVALEDAAAQDGHAEEDHGGHPTGVPMNWQADLALWSFIIFLLFLGVLGKFAWKPMIEGLDKREAGIRNAIAEAEENRRKSEALLADYQSKLKAAEQTVQAMVAEARRDAERTSQDLIAAAQRDVDAIRVRAKDEIRQAKDTALSEVFSQVNAQVILATEHVLGRALSDGDQDRLVGEALAQLRK